MTVKELLSFLESEGVSFPRGREALFDVDEGVPDTMQQAVVPIFCEVD